MTTQPKLRGMLIFAVGLLAFLMPHNAAAQTVLIDTGTPTGGPGQVLCGASCGAGATFQDIAGQFTLTSDNAISSVQGYMQGPATGGQINVVIHSDSAGLPGRTVFSQTFTEPNLTASGWVTFPLTGGPILSANTPYWLSFEPVSNSTIQWSMIEGAPSPLPNYAFFNSRNSGWIVVPSPAYGMRVSGAPAVGPSLVIDTGAPTDPADGAGLFSAGNKNCSPMPSCGQSFQFIAGQFLLAHASTIDSVQGWIGPIFSTGSMTVKIYADGGGFPSTAIFSQTYAVAPTSVDGWITFTFSSPLPNLGAGNYWLAFEPVANTAPTGTGLSTGMDAGAPMPLAKYAIWNESDFLNQFNNGYRALGDNIFSFGMRVSATSFNDLAFGAAGRATMAGATFGIPFNDDNITGGINQASVYLGAGEIPGGWSIVRGGLFPNSLSTGSWSGASICFSPLTECTDGSGSGRSVVFRSWTNPTTSNLTFSVNAVLDGSISNFGGAPGSAIGRVYLFDSALFPNTLASVPNSAQFLLNSVPADQDLGGLFPSGAVLTSTSQTLTGPTNTALTAPLKTSLITVAPGQSFTVMFDVATITPAGNAVDFFSTLAPANVLFTDQNGNAVTQLLALGPAVPAPAAPSALTLAALTSSNPIGGTYTATATLTDSNGDPIPSTVVYFAVTTGPNTAPTVPALTDVNGQATFTYTDAGGAGTDSIVANIGSLQSNTVQQIWTTPGPLDHITISPSTMTIVSGGSQTYTAQGFDVFNNSLGDVTTATTFGITPDGSCTLATCTASASGTHTVSGNDGGKTSQASLTVSASLAMPTITFAMAPTPTYLGGNFTVSATTKSNGALTYSYVSGPCAQVSGGTFSSSGAGACVVQAGTAATTTFSAGSTTQNVAISAATPTTTFSAAPAATFPGGNFTVSATTNSNGALTYSYVSGPCAQVSGGTFSSSGVGTCVIQASTAASTNFSAGSTTQNVNIVAAALSTPTITFASAPTPTYLGGNFTVSAITNSNGALTYSYVSGPCAQVGSGTFSSSDAGICVVKAGTAATTTFAAGSNMQNVTISPAMPTVTFAAAPTATFPGNFTVSATTNSNGALIYSYVSGPCTQVSGGTFSSSAVGTCVVMASTAATTNFLAGSITQNVVINAVSGKTNPVITWPTPAAIAYGTPLSSAQLDAKANVAGTFAYNPKAGTILSAGTQTLSLTFTPSNTSTYNTVTANVNLVVNQVKAIVVWVPIPTVYGTPLGSLQLDALTLVPGNFVYTPAAGTVLGAGSHQLSAIFTPKDTTNYATMTVQATVQILKAVPQITWPQPASITVGTALSATQLNAKANVPGTFVYNPPAGTKPAAGKSILTTTFTPTDSADYTQSGALVVLTVTTKH